MYALSSGLDCEWWLIRFKESSSVWIPNRLDFHPTAYKKGVQTQKAGANSLT